MVRCRSKRAKPIEEGTWECSVCTYKNSPEAFKCDMCDVRKGTSTRYSTNHSLPCYYFARCTLVIL